MSDLDKLVSESLWGYQHVEEVSIQTTIGPLLLKADLVYF